MSWEGFWLPNLINATVFAALAGLVGVLVRRWIKQAQTVEWLRPLLEQIFGEQQRTTQAAQAAEEQSKQAAVSAGAANESAAEAGDKSAQAGESIVYLAERLAVQDAVNEELRERIDRLLGTRARQLAAERPLASALLDEDDDIEPATETGRHRLHTQHIPTLDEGAPT